jgi:Protein of unknown function (DUF1282).
MNNIVNRVKNILFTPKTEWDVINSETSEPPKILTAYIIPLVLIGVVANFIGWGLIGKTTYGFTLRGIDLGIKSGIVSFIVGIASTFLTALVIDALAPTFKSEKNFGKSFQLAAYSYTPGWVGAVLNIIPSLATLALLAGLYGLYILYLGLPKLKNTLEDQTVGYFIVSLLTMIVCSFVLTMIVTSLLNTILASPII